jgi:hypothetical protein
LSLFSVKQILHVKCGVWFGCTQEE